jgi:hypothetical protein
VRRALRAEGERLLLLRLDGEAVRAVLGTAFVRLDDVFERVAGAVERIGWRDDLVVRFVATTASATVVRLTLRSSRLDVREGDIFERGIEIANGETGRHALTFTPLTWRARCFNFGLAPRSVVRIVHVRCGALRLEYVLQDVLVEALDAAGALLEAWRSSPRFDDANDITSNAKLLSLGARRAEERRGQGVVWRSAGADRRLAEGRALHAG